MVFATARSGERTSEGMHQCEECGNTIFMVEGEKIPLCAQCGNDHFYMLDIRRISE